MIHYTVLPMEVVMEGIEEMEVTSVEIVMNGIMMQVQPLNSTQATIVRITSCNPQDYLNPQYSPGRIIEFQPVS
ncbi:YlzJ-like family protein [Paenibacillus radicis (ex Xue et al. 2023)]|uniref:YlzJ-like family protein n=1 Tax=Paenibacillus radicis (ex Xue et al. 2023) TaxID=2972489 RepID=A0ABT1YC24_9BACL|nr:YlzJ-like family protein [Paenibacillus radicis (ex Xue et al. 2023)]MCR8630751.1 YlzJ-like family protein [Paenibacillus radicis (ex Xue et al. 2023)]